RRRPRAIADDVPPWAPCGRAAAREQRRRYRRAPLAQRLLGLPADLLEQLRVVDGELRQLLAVQLHAGLLHAVDERRVAHAERAHGGGQARDPQRAERALLLLAAEERERVGADDRLVGHAEQVAPPLAETLRALEHAVVALTMCRTVGGADHGS